MKAQTQDFGTVNFQGRSVLLKSEPQITNRMAGENEFAMQASGIVLENGTPYKCDVTWRFEDMGEEYELCDYDYDNVSGFSIGDPVEVEVCQVTELHSYVFKNRSQAHYAATVALFALDGGHDGSQTLSKLVELQTELEDTHTPAEVVEEFRKRGDKA